MPSEDWGGSPWSGFNPASPGHALARRARKAVQYAVREGKLARPERCEECGVTQAELKSRPPWPGASGVRGIEADHRSYRFPFRIRWLCPTCHAKQPTPGTGDDADPELRAVWIEAGEKLDAALNDVLYRRERFTALEKFRSKRLMALRARAEAALGEAEEELRRTTDLHRDAYQALWTDYDFSVAAGEHNIVCDCCGETFIPSAQHDNDVCPECYPAWRAETEGEDVTLYLEPRFQPER